MYSFYPKTIKSSFQRNKSGVLLRQDLTALHCISLCIFCLFVLSVLKEKEDPNVYLKKRPLSCPVLIVSESNCLLAIGEEPVHTLSKCEIADGVLYLMAYYYTLHLTYPKCASTLLSVIQTEVLLDKIHERDLTSSYKKAMADWKAFIGS